MMRLPRIAPAVAAEHLACVACLIALPLFVLSPAVFGGQFPLDSDAVLYQIPWEEAKPDGLPDEDPGGARNAVERYYPEFAFLNQASRAGESVQWNPLPGFGLPHLAQWRTRALSPFSIPFYYFDLRVAMTLSLVAKLFVAGLAAFVTARMLWLRPASALLAGVAFQLSPVFLLSPLAPIADTAAWFPFLLIVFERFGSGRTRVWPACAAVLALMLLGGDPETVTATLAFGTFSILIRTVTSGRGVGAAVTPVIVLGISALAAIAMTLVQILPFMEWLREAKPVVESTQPIHFSDLVLFALPRWYGAPDVSSIGGANAIRLIGAGFLFLSAPLLLAFPYWFAVRRELQAERKPLPDTLCISAAMLVVVGVIVGLAGDVAIEFLRITPAHFWFPLSLLAAFLLARTGEEWSRLMPDPCQDALKRFYFMLPAAPVLWVLLVLLSGPNADGVSRALQITLLSVAAIAFVAIATASALRPHVSAFAYGCTALVGLGSLYAFGWALPFRTPEQLFPETETVAAFRDVQGRVGGGRIAAEWPLTANGIAFANLGRSDGLDRQRAFERALRDDGALIARTGLRRLALRNAEMEVVFPTTRERMRIDRSFEAGAFWVELIDPVPRARLIYAARPVPTGSEPVIASHLPPAVEGGPTLLDEPPARGPWTDVFAAIGEPNAFDVDAAAPAVLVIAEAWYPGWRAFVDGNETVVVPVDSIFRGVPVPAGAHRVELIFDSQPYRIGRGVSALSSLVVLIAFVGRVWTAIRKRRKLR